MHSKTSLSQSAKLYDTSSYQHLSLIIIIIIIIIIIANRVTVVVVVVHRLNEYSNFTASKVLHL